MNPQRVGQAIKALRLQAGYTQRALADRLNITDKAVSKWERGLSAPDVSILPKLAVLLNCDVDNLLDGNVTYLEKTWKGLLILRENGGVFAGSSVYGKPMVDILLSYFLLAGIGDITVACPERDRKFIQSHLGDGSRLGIRLSFLHAGEKPRAASNTMAVYNDPFVYGANLTKYFQRGMSRTDEVSILTVPKKNGGAALSARNDGAERAWVPIVFIPRSCFRQIESVEDPSALSPLCAVPMGNGIIEYLMADEDALLDTAFFLRYLHRRMGRRAYDLDEVARNRGFLPGADAGTQPKVGFFPADDPI